MKLYVGNLAYGVTESELEQVFKEFGEVASVAIIKDKFSGQSKGFGFVEMPKNSEADAAIKGLNDRMVSGRKLKVNQAQPQRDRPPPRKPRY
jgi:RNA recognition motif-containing protein